MILRFLKILMWSLIAIWLFGFLLFSMGTQTKRPEKKDLKTDAIVVLTGGGHRIATGLELLANGMSKELLITGVNRSVRMRDITDMAPKGTKLPPCCIEIGYVAETTLENAIETKQWLKKLRNKNGNVHAVRLVTSPYHIDRALMEFRHAMPNTRFIPHPTAKSDYKLLSTRFWSLTFMEYNKIIFRKITFILQDGRKT